MKLIHCLTSPWFAQGSHVAAFERCGVHQKCSAAGQQGNTMPHHMSDVLPVSPVTPVVYTSKTSPRNRMSTAGSTRWGFDGTAVTSCSVSRLGHGPGIWLVSAKAVVSQCSTDSRCFMMLIIEKGRITGEIGHAPKEAWISDKAGWRKKNCIKNSGTHQ